MFAGPKGLEARLSGVPSEGNGNAPKVNTSGALQALQQAVGRSGGTPRSVSTPVGNLSIRGASTGGFNMNVVQVENLASETSAADVEVCFLVYAFYYRADMNLAPFLQAIFKRCGPILESYNHGSQSAKSVTVRLKFKNAEDAKLAVAEFNGKSADGHVLAVSLKGSTSTALSGRLGGGVPVISDSVDVLMGDDESSGGS